MATHPSILAWKTPGTEDPGGLHARVRHNLVTKQQHYHSAIWEAL